jgi:hypothetical protein
MCVCRTQDNGTVLRTEQFSQENRTRTRTKNNIKSRGTAAAAPETRVPHRTEQNITVLRTEQNRTEQNRTRTTTRTTRTNKSKTTYLAEEQREYLKRVCRTRVAQLAPRRRHKGQHRLTMECRVVFNGVHTVETAGGRMGRRRSNMVSGNLLAFRSKLLHRSNPEILVFCSCFWLFWLVWCCCWLLFVGPIFINKNKNKILISNPLDSASNNLILSIDTSRYGDCDDKQSTTRT